jgi:hypothetical protein
MTYGGRIEIGHFDNFSLSILSSFVWFQTN